VGRSDAKAKRGPQRQAYSPIEGNKRAGDKRHHDSTNQIYEGVARPADRVVKGVVNATAKVGATIEREKPKVSMASEDLCRSANYITFSLQMPIIEL
jgi:hypothetical protein